MPFNSAAAYLAYEERLSDPAYQLHGTQRRWKPVKNKVVVTDEVEVSEYELIKMEDEYLKTKGIN